MDKPKEELKQEKEDIFINGDGTATYFIREESDIMGTVSGPFQFKCILTPMDQLLAGKEYKNLIGQNIAESAENDRFLAWSLSQLRYRILKSPPFWTSAPEYPGNIDDQNIIAIILDKAITSEKLYKQQLKQRKEEALTKASDALKAMQEASNPKPELE